MSDDLTEILATDILSSLKRMDEEATTVINGVRTGLVDYAGHKGIKTKNYEIPIYRRLAELLTDAGYAAYPDQDYPDCSQCKCDLVIRKTNSIVCWLEAKIIWREWLSTATESIKTADFDSYVLGPGSGRLQRWHSIAQDFEKLEAIGPDNGSHLAVLAICFDSIHRPLDLLINQMITEQQLKQRNWRQLDPESWNDRNSSIHRIVCRLWFRDTRIKVKEHNDFSDSKTNPGLDHLPALVAEVNKFEKKATDLLRHCLSKGNDWYWESWIAEVINLPSDHSMVIKFGNSIRNAEGPYRIENYLGNPKGEERVTMRLLQYIRRELKDIKRAQK